MLYNSEMTQVIHNKRKIMKKLLIATILASAAGFASAADVTLSTGHNTATNQNMVGLSTTLAKSGALGVVVGADRSTSGVESVNRAHAALTADVAKVWGATVTTRVGAAFVDRSVNENGVVGVVGVSATYPLTKSVSAVADYSYQYANDRNRDLNGSIVAVGLRVAF
jgi:outer membrane autotransporter protein